MTDKEIMLALLEGKVLQDNADTTLIRLDEDGYLRVSCPTSRNPQWRETASIFCSNPNIGYDYLYRFSKVKD